MSACLEAASPIAPAHPSADSRAARLKTFEREQRIVDYLNRGVSIAEIAAQIGVGEKRMRAIIREILARRMPHPPEEFVAIQVSRLNEALLMAFSAMSPTNLKAVDQVVRIVRELDRYGGAFAAEWARHEAPRLEAPAEGDVAFAKAWLCSAELAGESGDDSPEIASQGSEKIESAPGNPLAPHSPSRDGRLSTPYAREEGWGEGRERLAAAGARPDKRPENLAQDLENIDSAPGIAASPEAQELAAPASPLAPHSPSRDGRLSTPHVREEGWGEGRGRLAAAGARLAPPPGLDPGADFLPAILGSGQSGPGRERGRFPASPSGKRPEYLAQAVEKTDSAPERGWLSPAATGGGSRSPMPYITPPSGP